MTIAIVEVAIISELVFDIWRCLRRGIIATGLYPVGVEAGRGRDVGCGRGELVAAPRAQGVPVCACLPGVLRFRMLTLCGVAEG